MKVFIVHRFAAKKTAVSLLKSLASKGGIVLQPIVLNSSGGDAWKSVALSGITDCEAVAVFDSVECMKSANAVWEIEQARELKKPLILLDPVNLDRDEVDKLYNLYHYNEEFNSFFRGKGKDVEVLYKMMVDSSEQLIQRRQKMNAFFITAIGSLLAISGALAKFGTIKSPATSLLLIAAFGITGLLLCNSWRKLIDNYGKLNSAKFRVILKLEQSLSAQVFSAEWTALGKGQRPQKYLSFTASENLVPLWFAILIFGLVFFAAMWKISA